MRLNIALNIKFALIIIYMSSYVEMHQNDKVD